MMRLLLNSNPIWVALDLLIALLSFFQGRKPVTTGKPRPRWLELAEWEIGFHEAGENRGIEHYIADAHCGRIGDPWCAIFVNAMLERAGVTGTRSAMARSFEDHPNFIKLPGPALGAITTMWRGSRTSGTGHVFFYIGESTKGIYALGGNQNDQVCRQYEPRDRIVGYYWPRSQPLPVIGPVSVDTQQGTITSKET